MRLDSALFYGPQTCGTVAFSRAVEREALITWGRARFFLTQALAQFPDRGPADHAMRKRLAKIHIYRVQPKMSCNAFQEVCRDIHAGMIL